MHPPVCAALSSQDLVFIDAINFLLGGGKTFVFESAILRFLGPDFGAGRVCGVAKVLYIGRLSAPNYVLYPVS